MQFELTDDVAPSLWVYFLWAVLVLAVPVGLPLLFWLRRRVRNGRDVLRSEREPPR